MEYVMRTGFGLTTSLSLHAAVFLYCAFSAVVPSFKVGPSSEVRAFEVVILPDFERSDVRQSEPPAEPPPLEQASSIPNHSLETDRRPSRKLVFPARQSGSASKGKGGDVAPQNIVVAPAAAVIEASAEYFRNPPPPYPEVARRRRAEGTVLLRVVVSSSGEASAVVVKQSSGDESLDAAAVRGVTGWRFQPGTVAGLPISSEVLIPIRFELKGKWE